MLKRKFVMVSAVVLAAASILIGTAGCGQQTKSAKTAAQEPAPQYITFGVVASLTGPDGPGEATTYLPVARMWVKEVNASGGIFIKEYNKKIPIKLITYDDSSDIGTMTRLFTKLIVQDKVDFLFCPWSTGFIYAAAPIANKYHKVLVGGSGGALELQKLMPKLPYYFQVLNYSDTQLPVLAKIYNELGIKTVAIAYGEMQNGVEYNQEANKVFPAAGLKIVMDKSFVLNTKDETSLLEDAKSLNADAFVAFSYPNDTITFTKDAIAHDINFKAMFLEVFTYAPEYMNMFGANTVEGIMGGGGWSVKSPGGAAYTALYQKYYQKDPEDHWGGLYYYASFQALQDAIQQAGTLDNTKVRDVLATGTFNTIIGPFKFNNQRRFMGFFGQICQWQNGVYQIVDPGKYRTATPEIKPSWPKQK